MTIKRHFILLASIIITIPILCIFYIFLQSYLKSPNRILIHDYKEIQNISSYEISENEWNLILKVINKIPNDIEFILLSPNSQVLVSKIESIKPGVTLQKETLIKYIYSASNKFIYQFQFIPFDKSSTKVEDTNFVLISRVKIKTKSKKNINNRSLLILFLLIIVFICVILIVFISKNIFNSIETLEKQMQAIANGNLSVKIDTEPKDKHTTNEITSISSSLEKMRISLIEAQNRKNKFIMGISHDLRTPVAIIKGYTEAIHDGIITEKEEMDKALELISIKTEQLEEMINTLINFMKLNNTEFRNKLFPSSITEVITSFAKNAQIAGNVFKRNISIDINIPENIIIPIDRQLINRALENLFSNALRYTKDNDSIFIHAHVQKKTILFSIEDSGCGIAEKDLNNIFDIFYRGTNSRREEGMGIGLSVVKNIIETHGWKIEVKSEINKGSCFTIYIPY